jgi:hypothetical protein
VDHTECAAEPEEFVNLSKNKHGKSLKKYLPLRSKIKKRLSEK